MKTGTLSRRRFIQLSSASGALLVVGCVPGKSGEEIVNASAVANASLNQFITIDERGHVILYNHRPEMGQGTFQSIPMILAEELEVNMDQVEIRQSEADRDLYGSQMVVGSRSIQTEFLKLRKMGAAAREMLISAAVDVWGAERSDCTAQNGVVTRSSTGEELTYGDLVEAASKLTAPTEPPLKVPSEFRIIGNPMRRSDIPLKTNGEAKFGIDISVSGMLYASIERSSLFLGEVVSYNEAEVMEVEGVRHVLKTQRNVFGRQREGVAVLADSYWAAEKGRKALRVEWDNKGLDKQSSETLLNRYYSESAKAGDELFAKGNASSALKSGNRIVEAQYEAPYQAHVPMEPMNAIVNVQSDEVEFWGSTQNPNGIRSFLAKKTGVDESRVKINYTFMGGGFGRRSMTDVAEEAADLSMKTGTPVKVMWNREDDLTQGPFRACSLNVLKGALDKGGNVIALEHKVIAQEIRNQTGDSTTAGRQLMGGINTHYDIPNLSVRGVLQKLHIPISYWRAVYHSTNPFAHESFMDELATEAGKDPLQFRLSMMQGHPRFKRVLEVISEEAKWGSDKGPGVGRGLAIAERSGAHFAMVVEVHQDRQEIRVKKITTALDLGICVNPDTVKAQTEGSIVMGLTAALNGLTISKGGVEERNFDRYPLLRIDECPDIDTHIIPSEAPPDGAGESGLPTVAPALANAIFDLTGKRIRRLPMDLSGIIS